MAVKDATNKVLEYLKKQGQTNTFRLSSELDIDRHRVLDIIRKLEEKRAVEVRSGIVNFLKFPRKGERVVKKKAIKVKKAPSKVIRKTIIKKVYVKPKKLKEQAGYIEKLEEKIKVLQKKVSEPKIIRRTITKKVPVVKRVYVKSKKLKEQAECIEELEEKNRELQEKAAHPKIIRKTIVKKIPVKVKEYITKTIVRKVPVKIKEKLPKKKKIKPKKFKLPKIGFSGLHKHIKKIHVPEMLKK